MPLNSNKFLFLFLSDLHVHCAHWNTFKNILYFTFTFTCMYYMYIFVLMSICIKFLKKPEICTLFIKKNFTKDKKISITLEISS